MSFIWAMYFAASSSTLVLFPGSWSLDNKSFSDLTMSAGDFWRPLPPNRNAMAGLWWYQCRQEWQSRS